ncbi:MAG: ergothioneine biosynthesis protein EgtB [Rhodothermales bacterium]|nr:ergothioneine biosynthesis protein EgtB [Rhodothermales bacterium]
MLVESLTESQQPLPKRSPSAILERYLAVRHQTDTLCDPLEVEDYVVQSMEDASPVRWHIAHTTWFFETFVLRPYLSGYTEYNTRFQYLFNSYYVQAGERFSRPDRGMLSRPTVREIGAYRSHVDHHMTELLSSVSDDEVLRVVEIGLNHEQQHQELILTDLKHMLSRNPLYPAYRNIESSSDQDPGAIEWTRFDGGLVEVGTNGPGFFFDNEGPRHKVYLEPFKLANRLVTNGEFVEFVEAGGYDHAPYWLSEGFATREREGWTCPPYWSKRDDEWHRFTLGGLQPVNPNEPVSQISYFEADAFARWAGARLATEFEWEHASMTVSHDGNFVDNGKYSVETADPGRSSELQGMFGNLWEWTRSQYSPYPGYEAEPGALGEYNGKFMSNQFVLRGGSFATARSHIRATYRNFFPAYARWQFTGIRLARDVR